MTVVCPIVVDVVADCGKDLLMSQHILLFLVTVHHAHHHRHSKPRPDMTSSVVTDLIPRKSLPAHQDHLCSAAMASHGSRISGYCVAVKWSEFLSTTGCLSILDIMRTRGTKGVHHVIVSSVQTGAHDHTQADVTHHGSSKEVEIVCRLVDAAP